jgi:hypothetical protein
LDQADRLMAKRSHGDEERDIDAILPEDADGVWSRVSDQTSRRGDRAHEREVARGYVADRSITRELAKPIEWQRNVAILGDAGVIERFTAMKFTEAADVGLGRDDTVRAVAAADTFIEGKLPGGHQASGRDERHATQRERLP